MNIDFFIHPSDIIPIVDSSGAKFIPITDGVGGITFAARSRNIDRAIKNQSQIIKNRLKRHGLNLAA